MCVVSIDTTFMTIGAAIVDFYSFAWAQPTTVVNREQPFSNSIFDIKNKNLDKNALLSCSTMCALSIDTTFATIGAAVVEFYSFVWAEPTAVVSQEQSFLNFIF